MDRLSDSDDYDDDTFLAVTHHDPNTRKADNHAARYASAKQLNQETIPLFCPQLRTIAELSALVANDRGSFHNESIVKTGDTAPCRSVTFNLTLTVPLTVALRLRMRVRLIVTQTMSVIIDDSDNESDIGWY